MDIQKKRLAIYKVINSLFKNSKGEPFKPTVGQCDIFESVINPKIDYVWLSGPTRYGKSDIISMAFLFLARFHHLKIPIVGGSEEKAQKIMEYVVAHLSDHSELYKGLLNADVGDVEKLKVTMSKQALRWASGGWIYVTSVDSRSVKTEGEKVVGEGGDIVCLEEAGLIKKKEQYSKIVRMPEENRGWGKLIMSGNCIENSVFETAYNDPLYYKVRIGLDQAIAEGRFTKEKLEKQKTQTTTKDWKRYYMVEFPKAGEFAYFKPQKYEFLPKEMKYYGTIDLALGDGKKIGDEQTGSKIAIVVLGVDNNGQRFEVDSIVSHMKPDQAMREIFNMQYKFERFGIEDVYFQRYFKTEAEKMSKRLGLGIPFIGIKQSKNKEERIESLEPAINTGQIYFKGGNQLWDDMQSYPDTKFLDGLDSLEMTYRLSEKKKASIGIGGQVW